MPASTPDQGCGGACTELCSKAAGAPAAAAVHCTACMVAPSAGGAASVWRLAHGGLSRPGPRHTGCRLVRTRGAGHTLSFRMRTCQRTKESYRGLTSVVMKDLRQSTPQPRAVMSRTARGGK